MANTTTNLSHRKFAVDTFQANYVYNICSCLPHAGTEVQKAQEFLRQRFLKNSFSKRKLWFGAPKLLKFNRRFGIVQNAPILSELDYASCHEMMEQFPSEIQELSMKSMLNKITQRENRVFIFKGPPGCGKTELISRVCSYWAKGYALRQFSLVLYLNVWNLRRSSTFPKLIDELFKGSTVSSERICCWIEEQKGNEVMFILDGFCRKYLYQSPLRKGEMLSDILFGHSSFSKSTVVISTTCSDFVKPRCGDFTQFDILGLSDKQIGKQIFQHFDSERAFNFLSYLAGNPEIKVLVSSPSYLIGIMYVFSHISYDDLPVTWTQLYTSLVVLVSEWQKEEATEYFATDPLQSQSKSSLLESGGKNEYLAINSLQTQFKHALLENGRKVIEDSGDLLATLGKSFIHDAEDFDYVLPDLNSAVPYLQSFLFSLETICNSDSKKLVKALKGSDKYFWNFLAGLEVETNSMQLLKQYYQGSILKMTNCLSESGYVTAEQQILLFSTAKVGRVVVTTHDIHSILHCLPYMKDPHTLVIYKCFLGTQAVRDLSKFLAANSWSNDHSGIRHLQ